MIDKIILNGPVFLLVFIRCFTMLLTLPLFSMRSISRVAKVALAGYMAFFIFGTVNLDVYSKYLNSEGVATMEFILVATGEALIGVILGFYITIIFAAFSTAGQFTAFQMGFSAASTYDALSQVENPLMGQFFNFIAMLIFIQGRWFQKLFLGGLVKSFSTLNCFNIVENNERLITFILKGLTKLFADAMIIALPVMGTLVLITICTGLLTKAAPQMNLLSEGFPVMILTSFLIIYSLLPNLIDFFMRSFEGGFANLEQLFKVIQRRFG